MNDLARTLVGGSSAGAPAHLHRRSEPGRRAGRFEAHPEAQLIPLRSRQAALGAFESSMSRWAMRRSSAITRS
jgi:hypothetical protein